MVILLDIDGVLLPANSWSKPELMPDGFSKFSYKASVALQKIITATSANIILTTSHKATYELSQWEEMFNARGIRPVNIDRLSTDSLTVDRDIKDHLILTSSSLGLTDELADQAIAVLLQKS